MPAILRHFAVDADNAARAMAFYERVFGWDMSACGPPDFYPPPRSRKAQA